MSHTITDIANEFLEAQKKLKEATERFKAAEEQLTKMKLLLINQLPMLL